MNRIRLNIFGEMVDVLDMKFGECPKCGRDTYPETINVYGDSLYDREVCTCGWWANALTSSDEVEKVCVTEAQPTPEVESSASEDIMQEISRQYKEIYGILNDIEGTIDDEYVDGRILKMVFDKVCYDNGVKSKELSAVEVYSDPGMSITTYSLMAVIDCGNRMEIFNTVIPSILKRR